MHSWFVVRRYRGRQFEKELYVRFQTIIRRFNNETFICCIGPMKIILVKGVIGGLQYRLLVFIIVLVNRNQIYRNHTSADAYFAVESSYTPSR